MNTLEAALNLLRRHNKWRRGDETVEMPDPAMLGCAIDVVCEAAEGAQAVAAEYLAAMRVIHAGPPREPGSFGPPRSWRPNDPEARRLAAANEALRKLAGIA